MELKDLIILSLICILIAITRAAFIEIEEEKQLTNAYRNEAISLSENFKEYKLTHPDALYEINSTNIGDSNNER